MVLLLEGIGRPGRSSRGQLKVMRISLVDSGIEAVHQPGVLAAPGMLGEVLCGHQRVLNCPKVAQSLL